MGSIGLNGKEGEGKEEGIYPVWLCVALEILEIRIEGYSLVQKAAELMTTKHI